MRPERVVVLTAVAVLVATFAEAATVMGRVDFLTRRGQRPNRAETLVWLEGPGVKPLAPSSFRITTRAKTLIPHILAIPVGSSVEFPNEDPVAHNLFSLSSPNQFDLGFYRRGAGKRRTFDHPGLVNVYCNVHPTMSAVIHVMSTPHYSLTNGQGSFSIVDVAPGTYRAYAWNEMGGLAESELIVADGPSPIELMLTIDGTRYRPEQHLDKDGKPYSRSNRRDY